MANNYNPDVLNCIANLSNDEVFTPPALANQVLDMLPQELFKNPGTTFLDPFTKSGVFLREIVKRLDRGLEGAIPDRQERIDHIMHRQVFGIACTELTAYLSRRSLYCTKHPDGEYSVSRFGNPEGNIQYKALRHTWEGGKCRFCGASKEVYDRGDAAEQYAYQFIHTDNPESIFNMKFDVIIGNPPYQLSTGSVTAQAVPLYDKFVEKAKLLNPTYLSMIIPSRWYAGGMGLDSFRKTMLSDNKMRVLVDFNNASDCFPGVNIGGGVCYFLWDSTYSGPCKVVNNHNGVQNSTYRGLNEFPVFVKYNKAIDIIHKVKDQNEPSMSTIVSSISPFGIPTKVRGTSQKDSVNNIKLHSSKDITYISGSDVIKNDILMTRYKVFLSHLVPGKAGEVGKDGKHSVFGSTMKVAGPNEVCTHTYLTVGCFEKEQSAKNLLSYMKTKFLRFLVYMAVCSIDLTKSTFIFAPLQNFDYQWTDELLYEKYGINREEQKFIDSLIKDFE